MAKAPKNFASVAKGYANLWKQAIVRPERRAAVSKLADKYYKNIARYHAVQEATGVPSWWVFCVHERESGANFSGILHNGEKIIGTGRKTNLVPKGRGPFASWQDAAIDAVKQKGLDKIKEWNAARCLYEFERYNGFGYYGKGIRSPYVWADTNLEEVGKYVADGKYDPNADDKQVGCAALLKIICERSPAIDAVVNDKPAPTPVPVPVPVPIPVPVPPTPQVDWQRIVQLLMEVIMQIKSATDVSKAEASGKTAAEILEDRKMSTNDVPKTALVGVKPWYTSKTVWLAVIAAVAPIVNVLTQGSIDLSPTTQDWIAGIISVVAGLGAAASRVTADTVMPAGAEKARHG